MFRYVFQLLTLMLVLSAGSAHAEPPLSTPDPPATIDALEVALLEVMKKHQIPGAGVALLMDGQPVLVKGLGNASLEPKRAADADTLFRIGSASKGFAALAVLQLVESGRLRLDDTLEKLLPDVSFDNPWAPTDPLRLVHVLEHTAGFDDWRLREYANLAADRLPLADAMRVAPESRRVRWRPGSRYAYSNSGVAVAALVVERITGQVFEDYVSQHLFAPLQMQSTSYFQTAEVLDRGASLYEAGGNAVPYWHVLMRPAGAINSSARDMANYLAFYLRQGEFSGQRVISADSLSRMQRGESLSAAKLGLQAGYGLANYTVLYKGFVLNGHNGGLAGGLTTLNYLAEQGRGYVLMLNSDNGEGFRAMNILLRDFLIQGLPKPELPPVQVIPPALAQHLAGYYQMASPRQQVLRFVEILGGLQRVTIDGEKLDLSPVLSNETTHYVYVGNNLFRLVDAPISSLAAIEGEPLILQNAGVGGWTAEQWPAWRVWLLLSLMTFCVLMILTSPLFLIWWLIRLLRRHPQSRAQVKVWIWPMASVACLAALTFVLTQFHGMNDWLQGLGTRNPRSMALCVLSLAFALCALIGLATSLKSSAKGVGRAVYGHSLLLAFAVCLTSAYLAYWGIIGIRTWS